MPIVTIHMLKGRDKEKRKELIKNVTAAVTKTLDVAEESVRVILNEMENENFGVAGLPIMEYRSKKTGAGEKGKS
ncbi:MAG: 2-hydroxymuconate tautomerase family protein [Candidatus Aminicenantes bacterium]|nr:2-hydroxymuconate tautomerase family protein [Candidatus Aminicenantes bacterium]